VLRAIALTLVFLLSDIAPAAEPAVLLMEVTPRPDPEWRDRDVRTLRAFRGLLDARSGLRMVPQRELEALFKEPAERSIQPHKMSAREHFKKGKGFSERLKPKQAIWEFTEALRILRAIFSSLDSLVDLEEAHLQLGMTYQALGKDRKAAHEYRMVLLLNPQRKLDDTTVNPVVVKSFNRKRERLLTSMTGSISLITRPRGARVDMNGRLVGYTPITIPGVYPGEHYFTVNHDGYKTWSGVLRVKPGALEKKEVFLAEGQRIRWVRLRNRIGQAGIGQASAQDVEKFANAVGADWLLLAIVSHQGGRAMLELGIFESGGQQVNPLGIFAVEEGQLAQVVESVEGWLQDNRKPSPKTDISRKLPDDIHGGGGLLPPPLPPPHPPDSGATWYESWWFWTAVGVIAAGAATVPLTLYITRDSGIKIDVYR
jgi:tetratricopeptide (TPR) repeat protein